MCLPHIGCARDLRKGMRDEMKRLCAGLLSVLIPAICMASCGAQTPVRGNQSAAGATAEEGNATVSRKTGEETVPVTVASESAPASTVTHTNTTVSTVSKTHTTTESTGKITIRGEAYGEGSLKGLKPVKKLASDTAERGDAFTAGLLKGLYEKGENLFISPASLYLALAMTANGAAGNTLSQMLSVLQVKDLSALNQNCRDIQSLLVGNEKNSFRVANAIWLEKSVSGATKRSFLDRNRSYYGALVRVREFDKGLMTELNGWVEQQTDGKIKNLMEQPPNPEVVMLLVNTLLFNGKWSDPFTPGVYTDHIFHAPDGDKTVSMMGKRLDSASWYEDDSVQATMMDFTDGRTAMLLALPKNGLDGWMSGLSADKLSALVGMRDKDTVILSLPRFSMEYGKEMKTVLEKLGMTEACQQTAANFGEMADPAKIQQLYIGSVQHKAVLEVTEQGVSAAAGTLIEMKCRSAYVEQPKQLTLDRPFFCAIVDRPTGMIWFTGTVNDPQPVK